MSNKCTQKFVCVYISVDTIEEASKVFLEFEDIGDQDNVWVFFGVSEVLLEAISQAVHPQSWSAEPYIVPMSFTAETQWQMVLKIGREGFDDDTYNAQCCLQDELLSKVSQLAAHNIKELGTPEYLYYDLDVSFVTR